MYLEEKQQPKKKLNSDATRRLSKGLMLSNTFFLNTFCTNNHKILGGAFAASFS